MTTASSPTTDEMGRDQRALSAFGYLCGGGQAPRRLAVAGILPAPPGLTAPYRFQWTRSCAPGARGGAPRGPLGARARRGCRSPRGLLGRSGGQGPDRRCSHFALVSLTPPRRRPPLRAALEVSVGPPARPPGGVSPAGRPG